MVLCWFGIISGHNLLIIGSSVDGNESRGLVLMENLIMDNARVAKELVRIAKELVGSISGKVQPLYFPIGGGVRLYWIETLSHFELDWSGIIELPKHIKKVGATMNLRAVKVIREFQFDGHEVETDILNPVGHITFGNNRMQIVGDGGIDVMTDDVDALISHLEANGFEEA